MVGNSTYFVNSLILQYFLGPILQKIIRVTLQITLHFVALDIKAYNNYTTAIYAILEICARDDFYFTLVSRIKFLLQWDFENLLF
jgi:hypothetical protein